MEKKLTKFQRHCEEWKDGCGSHICSSPGTNRVFFRGVIPCDMLFIGEAPGESENVLRSPFMGPAGKLLDIWIEDSIGEENEARKKEAEERLQPLDWKKITYGMTNLVGCIPREADGGKSEAPDKATIKLCSSRLINLVRICQPRVIILVGTLAKKHVIGQAQFCIEDEDDQPPWIPDGQFLEFADIDHPAFILRQNIAQRGLSMQRATIIIRNMIKRFLK